MGYGERDLNRIAAGICIKCQLRSAVSGIHCQTCRRALNAARPADIVQRDVLALVEKIIGEV